MMSRYIEWYNRIMRRPGFQGFFTAVLANALLAIPLFLMLAVLVDAVHHLLGGPPMHSWLYYIRTAVGPAGLALIYVPFLWLDQRARMKPKKAIEPKPHAWRW